MEYLKDGNTFFIRLIKDENIFKSLEEVAKAEGLTCAHINGIGAIKNVELGFYHLESKHYDRKTFSGEYELLSLVGNLSLLDGKPFYHIHTSMGCEDFSVKGGHLFNADCAVTVEIELRALPFEIERKMDEGIGLNLLSMCQIPHN
ncbi:MAG: DNA-binding protein [Oligoflexia bacterium]|nr:DNA-binding protein [Oligoflexia bacterium]